MTKRPLTSSDWFGKASAGLILGFLLSLGLCGVFGTMGPGSISFNDAQGQVTMWLMAPFWTGFLSFCFLFGSTLRAWVWLGAANVAVWGLLYFAGKIVGAGA